MMRSTTSPSNTAQATIFDPVFAEISIGDLTAVVAYLNGQTLLRLPDVAELVGVDRKKGARLLSASRQHGLDAKRDVVKLKPTIGQKLPMHFLRHEALRAVAKAVASDRATVLTAWLDNNPLGAEARFIEPAAELPQHGMAETRQRAYSAQLAAVIAQHATPKELLLLVRTLHGVKSDILANRYAPELNSSVYDLYATYSMQQPSAGAADSKRLAP